MNEHEALARAAAAPVARLATRNADGGVDLVPITFALGGRRLVTAVDHKPKTTSRLQRLANIRREPSVTVLVDHYEDDWSALWWVRLRGDARVVESGSEHEAAVAELAAKYAQYRERPPVAAVIVVALTDWRAWSAAPS